MAPQTEPPPILISAPRQRSILVKLTAIGALLLLLHVPLIMTHGVLRDRQRYQAQATDEVSGIWGRAQRVIGPVLAVPYTYKGENVIRSKRVNGQWVQTDEPAIVGAVAYFLPDQLNIESVVEPEVRHRGIYDVVVYAAHLKLTGTVRADFTAAGIDAEHVDWARSRLLVGISDLHGLRSIAPLHRADGTDANFETEAGAPGSLALGADPALGSAGTVLSFSLEAVVQGSGTLRLAPVGRNTTARMRSSWHAPSFMGAWLPINGGVSRTGFDVEWTIPPFSHGYPQSWSSRSVAEADMIDKIDSATFGVRLGSGADGYSVVERAQKYGVLFFVLVFAVFFLFEVTSNLSIHPLQYAMVGAALCLFFLGFLALSEFWPNSVAYFTAAGACTAMVSLYAWSFLKSGGRTLLILGGLGATYAYLYFVLRSEDYALIAGTAALFAMLGLAMYVTRRINWHTLANSPAPVIP